MKLQITAPIFLLLISVSAQSTANPWGQCGGSTLFGRTYLCPAGQSCVVMNEFYSQCLPVASSTSFIPSSTAQTSTKITSTLKTSTTTKKPTKTSTTAAATSSGVPLYGQCGGLSWYGPKVCAPPGVCTYENPYFSNCFLPGYLESLSSAAAAAATSTAP